MLLTIRPWVGKNADSLSADLKNIARSLQTDSFEPWREVIHIKAEANLEDGWAHSEDDSLEGMRRELDGMVSNDRHERVIAAFEAQLHAQAERKQREVEQQVLKRRDQTAVCSPEALGSVRHPFGDDALKLPATLEMLKANPDACCLRAR